MTHPEVVAITVVRHAGGACVKPDPHWAELAVHSCIVLEADDLALAVGWFDALAEVGHRRVHPAPNFLLPHADSLSIQEHHPMQAVPEAQQQLLTDTDPLLLVGIC